MKTNYKFFGMLLASLAISFGTMAQTMPAAQSLPYTQDFSIPAFGTLAATTTLPAGWQGWRLAGAVATNPARTATLQDQAIKFGDAATTGSGCYNFDGKIGGYSTSFDHAVCLAVNTIGKSNIKVIFDAITLRNTYDGITLSTGYQHELALQYRVGETGSFTNIAYLPTAYNSGTVVNTSGTTGVNPIQGLNVVLPATCDNQAVVQIRWANRLISGTGTSSRPSMAIDNVSVTEDLTLSNNADLTSLSVDEKADNNFVPLTMFGASTYDYNYYLVKGNPIPVISGVKSQSGATTVVTQATSLTGTDTEKTAKIEVTAQDGTTIKTYSVKFIETDNVFQSGLYTLNTGAPIGWSQSGMYFGNTKIDGNNKYEGANYARCMSASTASNLRLPSTNSVGTLRFYAKKIDTNVVGNFKVSKKINDGEWTVVQDLGDISNSTYQEFSVAVNQTATDSMFVRIEITKNGDTYPSAAYYIDDISYNASTIPTALNRVDNHLNAYVLNGQLMLMEGDIFNSIGVKVASVKPTNTITAVKLNRGIYIVKSKMGTQKIVVR